MRLHLYDVYIQQTTLPRSVVIIPASLVVKRICGNDQLVFTSPTDYQRQLEPWVNATDGSFGFETTCLRAGTENRVALKGKSVVSSVGSTSRTHRPSYRESDQAESRTNGAANCERVELSDQEQAEECHTKPYQPTCEELGREFEPHRGYIPQNEIDERGVETDRLFTTSY